MKPEQSFVNFGLNEWKYFTYFVWKSENRIGDQTESTDSYSASLRNNNTKLYWMSRDGMEYTTQESQAFLGIMQILGSLVNEARNFLSRKPIWNLF